MKQEEKSLKLQKAEEQVRIAQVRLAEVQREEKQKERDRQNRHKYMIGGTVAKYFPECYSFSQEEMCRIIAGAFKNQGVQNLINLVIKDRDKEVQESEQNKD